MNHLPLDLLVVGSGVAGLSAVVAAPEGLRVALIGPSHPLQSGSSWRAQGGVAVALGRADSPEIHAEDTCRASRFVASELAVKVLTEEGPERVRELLDSGLPCDRDDSGQPCLGLEAAHSRPRILHHQDRTGRALVQHLWRLACARPNTTRIPGRVTSLLLSERGVQGVVLDAQHRLHCPRVILASGGFAGLFGATTTGPEVRGEGLTLARAAGAQLADLEFVQFHPTALDLGRHHAEPLPLLTEALRGAGAVLVDAQGHRFVDELRGRDEVARAVAAQRRQGPVFLDVRPVEQLAQRFPEALAHLDRFPDSWGRLPVCPAAHFTLGGVVTDLHGATAVDGLYACGEVARVGVHGANRLASNSLLEGLVFGARAARSAASTLFPSRPSGGVFPTPAWVPLSASQARELSERLDQACGIVREAAELEGFLDWLSTLPPAHEVTLASAVAQAALARPQSLGAHFRGDAGNPPAELAIAG